MTSSSVVLPLLRRGQERAISPLHLQAAARKFLHRVVIKKTAFRAERQNPDAPVSIQELYGLLACDAARNDMVFNDVLLALETGRSPVVITQRKDHLQAIAERLTKFAKNVIVLKGGMGAKQRHQVNGYGTKGNREELFEGQNRCEIDGYSSVAA